MNLLWAFRPGGSGVLHFRGDVIRRLWVARRGGSGVLHLRGDVIHRFGPITRARAVYYIPAEM